MAKQRRKRSRGRRARRRNPIPQWGIAIGATAALAAVGYGGYRYYKRRKLASSPMPGLEGSSGPGGAFACEIGPDYPGFVQEEGGACVPSGTTPAGIYVDRACQDFVFVPGDDGPQIDNLELLIAAMAIQSQQPVAPSADPLVLAIGFLHKYWPDCHWPPTADSPPRLIHMFEALTFLIGRSIIEKNGRVLGTKSQEVAAEVIADRLDGIGLPAFDVEIVPELADWVSQDQGGGLGKTGGDKEPSEKERLQKKICDAPGQFTAFEKIFFINEVISPILDNRVEFLGPNPTMKQLDTMFNNIAHRVMQRCSPAKRAAGLALAKKFAHDLWVQRYHGGVGIDTTPPPTPPPPVHPGGGFQSPELPECYIDPFLRNQSHVSERRWDKSYDPYEIVVFEHEGKWAACDDFDLTVGVCVQVIDSQKPYGHLSNYAPNFPGYLQQFPIMNANFSQPFGFGKGEYQVDPQIQWNQFRTPPTYKRQLRWRLHYVLGNLEISPLQDLTGAAEAAIVDPCAGQPSQWPIPTAGHFNVLGDDGKWHAWRAEPKIELVKKSNTQVALRVSYTGVPVFAAGEGGPYSSLAVWFPSKTKLQIHSMAKGRTP